MAERFLNIVDSSILRGDDGVTREGGWYGGGSNTGVFAVGGVYCGGVTRHGFEGDRFQTKQKTAKSNKSTVSIAKTDFIFFLCRL